MRRHDPATRKTVFERGFIVLKDVRSSDQAGSFVAEMLFHHPKTPDKHRIVRFGARGAQGERGWVSGGGAGEFCGGDEMIVKGRKGDAVSGFSRAYAVNFDARGGAPVLRAA